MDSMWDFVVLGIFCSSLKLLLLPSYRSTDFEVHRNWMAITHSLPLKEWYFNNISEWTLDYPPFFAYLEWLLSQIARYFDPQMLVVENLNYASPETIIFQRGSVIILDIFLMIATHRLIHSMTNFGKPKTQPPKTSSPTLAPPLDANHINQHRSHLLIFSIVIFNSALLLVDHIHFQYNGILLALLIFCIDCAFRGHHIMMAISFSTLVLLKHLFVTLAPLFAYYLLACHCNLNLFGFHKSGESSTPPSFSSTLLHFKPLAFLQLVCVAFAALAIAFGPFLLQDNPMGQMQQIAARLFPFGRGLVHAYWAPNFWALYCFVDKVAAFFCRKLQKYIPTALSFLLSGKHGVSSSSSTSGLIGFEFELLPNPGANVALAFTFASMTPAFLAISRDPSPLRLLKAAVYCTLSSFMLGYHVHEKAILLPLLLQAFLSTSSTESTLLFLDIACVGAYGIFPLFTQLPELLIKGKRCNPLLSKEGNEKITLETLI